MGTKIIQDTSLISVADAIRTKGATTEPMSFPDGFVSAINDLPVDLWTRPAEWPDYNKIDRTDMEAVFFTYDCRFAIENPDTEDWMSVYANTSSGAWQIDRGYIDDTGFVSVYNQTINSGSSYYELLPTSEGDYVVYRMTAVEDGAHLTYVSMHNRSGQNASYYVQRCVERWGRLPYTLRLGKGWAYAGWSNRFVQAESIIDCVSLTTLQATWQNCYNLKFLDYTGWDTSNVTSLANAWQSCYSISKIDLSGWDISNVTSLAYAWQNCLLLKNIINIENLNTSNVTALNATWSSCYSLEELNLSNWDTAKVTTIQQAWYNCQNLQALDLSNWDTSAMTVITQAWQNCTNLQTLNLNGWSISGIKTLANTWNGCQSLGELSLSNWDTSAVTTFQNIFSACSALRKLDLTGWDTSAVTNVSNAFNDCFSLSVLTPCTFYLSFTLNESQQLTDASLAALIESLGTVTSATLTLGSTLAARLSEEQVAAATTKGWTIA